MDEDRMVAAAEAVRALRPPPLASEAWVRANAVGQLLPGLTDQLAKKAAAEALRMAQADGFGAVAAMPPQAAIPAALPLETPPTRPSLASAARLLKSAEPTRADLLYPQSKGTQR
jgi:hypothetical protein